MEVSAPKAKIAQPDEVGYFLQVFHQTKSENGIVFLDRQKNVQALLDLDISATEREAIIDSLEIRNYYKGPRNDGVRIGGEFWEFGVVVNGMEVYVKLSIGIVEGPVLCFSFHPSERRITYPYRGY